MESVLEELNALPADQATEAIIEALRNRPELAPAVVVAACPDLTYAPAKAATERREVGFIKSFNVKNGYGFIESPEVRDIFNQDAFLHKRQMGIFMVGQQVSFAVMLNDENKPQAFDLQPVGAPLPGMPAPGMLMPGMPPGMPMAGPFASPGPPLPMRSRGLMPDPSGRRFRGVLRRATREPLGRDFFAHKAKGLKVPADAGQGDGEGAQPSTSLKRAPDPDARMPSGRSVFTGSRPGSGSGKRQRE